MKKIFTVLVSAVLLTGCSTKKDTFISRSYHNTTAWFNTLFNAEKAFDAKILEESENFDENYSEILPVNPMPAIEKPDFTQDFIDQQSSLFRNTGNTAPQALTGFDLVEQKAAKAIENHSMMINGKEKNKEIIRAYLLLGKARYYKGKGFQALEAFNYMQNNLPYHKKYTPEAQLYTSLANFQIGNDFEGEKIIDRLYRDGGYKKWMKEEIAKNYAQHLIDLENYEEAIPFLENAIQNSKNRDRKARYNFIQGQLYSILGDQTKAGEAFTRVFNLKPGFEMEVKSQLGIAANFDPEINSYNSYKAHLLDVSKKGNYVSRKNEFYYAIGDIAIKANKPNEAREYLKKSFEGNVSDPYIRGRAYERYADLELNEGNYVHASAYYDSAVTIMPYEKDIQRITKRSYALNTLMERYYLVKKNDSILRIAAMSPEDKNKFFTEYIDKLKKEDEKRKRQMEEEATVFQTQTGGSKGFGSTFEGGGNTFYFYNNSLKSNGKNDFERIWGRIRLADNWRTSASANTGPTLEEQEALKLGKVDEQSERRYELEYYLEQIPNKQSELTKLKIERDTAELSLGIGYFDLFENAKTATATLEHLISTPPKEEDTEAQANYQLYRIYNKIENTVKAEEYKNLILTKYPTSIYAEKILNPEFDFITPTTQEALALYEKTYTLYKEDKFDAVKSNVQEAISNYPTEEIIAKFALLNALSIGRTEGRDSFISALELVTVVYENTDEAGKAQEILDLLNGKAEKAISKSESGEKGDDERKKQEIEQKEKEAAIKKDTPQPTSKKDVQSPEIKRDKKRPGFGNPGKQEDKK